MPEFHFITENPWGEVDKPLDITFKIRHTPEFTKGVLTKDENGYHILSSEKLQGIAPGQFGVIYDVDSQLCIGSGEMMI